MHLDNDGCTGSGLSCTFDADTGALRDTQAVDSDRAGDAIGRWLVMLHMAAMGGLAMMVFVCTMGTVNVALSVIGSGIWLEKRRAEQTRRR